VVLLHGTGGHWETFAPNLAALSQHFHCVAIDMVGNGFSDKPDYDYEIAVYVEHVLGVMDHFGMASANFIAMSLGAFVASAVCVGHADRVDRVILMSPAGREASATNMARIRAERTKAVNEPTWESLHAVFAHLIADEANRLPDLIGLRQAVYRREDTRNTIDRLLTTHAVPPEALILEITESTFANDSSRSRKTVFALRRLGVRISLDDYGTGWSSLARLQDLSVDELKLDRVFVSRLAEDPRSIAIVRSTVALAHSLGADLVAEGVEEEATLSALRRYGCNITQGFVHTPPLPADELLRWMATCTPQLPLGDLALHPEVR